VIWDATKFDLHTYMCCGGFLLSGTCKWNNLQISFLNSYGPCQNRKYFWDKVETCGLLDLHNLILAGGLNFTTNSNEIWGDTGIQDPLATYFNTLCQSHGLIDCPPTAISPTLCNDGSIHDSISKHLDHFYVS